MRRFNGLRLAALIKKRYLEANNVTPLSLKAQTTQLMLQPRQREMSSMKDCLLTPIAEVPSTSGNKVTIVGSGQVGMACAMCILSKQISSDICLLDMNEDRIQGEMMDLQHGARFMNNPKITASTDYAASACSRVCVIAAGARHAQGETRLALVQKNTDIMKAIIPKLIEHSPDTILLIVANPVDITTYTAWKISGFPKNRVFGSGTNLDSARFRFFIGQLLGVAPTSVHGWVIGEHGDSSVAVWSGVNVAGVRLRELNPKIGIEKDPEKWDEIPKKVITAGYEVMQKKGYTNWAIGLSVASIVSSLLRNTNEVMAVSTYVLGQHCIDKEVFMSLPCVLNGEGVSSIVQQRLEPGEIELLQKSGDVLYKAQAILKF